MPWEFADKDNKFVGFEIDLVNEIGKRLGRPVEITNIPFNGLFAAVESGRIDGAVSSITITPKRLQSLSFAQPYYDSDQSLTVKTDSGITALEGLKDKVVGVDTGSTGDMWTTENQAKYGYKEIKRYEGSGAGHAGPGGGPVGRLHQRHPGAAVLHQGQAAVEGGAADQDEREVQRDVRQRLAADGAVQRPDHGAEEGRHARRRCTRSGSGSNPTKAHPRSTVTGHPEVLGEAAAPAALAGPPLKVGANIGNVPWEFQDQRRQDGRIRSGPRHRGRQAAGRVKIENIPFNGLFSAVQSGQIDTAMSSITITTSACRVSFAQPYYDSDQSLTVTAASGLKRLDDMKGKIVGVDTGSTGDMWATENQAKYGFAEIRVRRAWPPPCSTWRRPHQRLHQRHSGPAILLKDKPQFAVVQRIPTGEKYSMMFAKDAPLVPSQRSITALKEEGFRRPPIRSGLVLTPKQPPRARRHGHAEGQ